MSSKALVAFLFVSAVALIQSGAGEDVREVVKNKVKLAKALSKDYEKLIAPGNTTLQIGVAFICAHYDESEERLHTRVFERFSWKDWRLTWNPKDYGDLRVLKAPSNLIWTPSDVKLFNAVGEGPVKEEVNAVILSDGTVYWISPVSYTTLCGPGEKLGDKKGHCHLTLGSWTHDVDDLPYALFRDGADQKYYLDDCPNVINNLSVRIKTTKYDCCPDPYPSLEIDFDLEPRTDWKLTPATEEKKKDKKAQRKFGVDCEWPHCV